MSAWVSIDTFITKSLLFTLKWLAKPGLMAIGLTVFISLHAEIFEYSEGTADLSVLEISVILLFVVLMQRHIYYCNRAGMGFWSGLTKIMTGMGYLGLLILAAGGVFVALSVEYGTGDLNALFNPHTTEDFMLKIVDYAVFIFAVYLSAPIGTVSTIDQIPSAKNKQES